MLRYAVVPLLLSSAAAHAGCPAAERGPAAVEAAALAYDAAAISQLVDTEALADRALDGIPSNAAMRAGFVRGVESTRDRFGANLFATIKTSGMQLAAQDAPGDALIVRKETASLGGGIDYLEFVLSSEGCIVDVRSLMLGTSSAGVARQSVAATLGDGNALTRMLGIDSSETMSTEQLQELAAAMKSGDLARVVALIDAMPDAYRDSFEFSMLRVGLLAQIDAESSAYALALQDMERLHGRDERVRYMMIDRYFISKRFDEALAAVLDLQKRVGVDPQNEVLRASVLLEAGRNDEALDAIRHVAKLDPERPQAHDLVINIAVQLERWTDALAAMDVASETLGIEFTHELLSGEPSFAPLLASEEYAVWRSAKE